MRSSASLNSAFRFAVSLTLALSILPGIAAAFDVPPNDGFITDTAQLLSEEDRASLSQSLEAYRTQTSNEIAVLIVDSLEGEPIADVATEVGRKWGIGTKDKDNGILILVSYTDREIFIATGYGLEGAVPDIVAKGVIEEDIAPKFRDGDYAGGIKAGVESLEKHIGGEYTADRYAQQGTSEDGSFFGFLFFLGIVVVQALYAFLGKTKSWWLGGVIGGGAGLILSLVFSWWWSVPVLVIVGLVLDLIASKTYSNHKGRRGNRWWMGGGGFGGSSGGGFGGFSGGSFGGGGARGKW